MNEIKYFFRKLSYTKKITVVDIDLIGQGCVWVKGKGNEVARCTYRVMGRALMLSFC